MKKAIGNIWRDPENPQLWRFFCDRSVRFTIDGSEPTSIRGYYLEAGEELIIADKDKLKFKVILAGR
jgi:hypothetical protein